MHPSSTKHRPDDLNDSSGEGLSFDIAHQIGRAARSSLDDVEVQTGLIESVNAGVGRRTVKNRVELPGHDSSSCLMWSLCEAANWRIRAPWLPGLVGVHQMVKLSPHPGHAIEPQRCPLWFSSRSSPALRAAVMAAWTSFFGCRPLLAII